MKSHKDEVRTANGSVLTMATVYDRGWNEGQKVLVAQSCLTLWHPMDCSLPASSVHRIFQARVLEWVAIPFSRGSSWPRDWTWVSCIASRFLTIWVHRNEGQFSSVAQSCPTLCDPMDCSLPGSSVHRIFQARVLEWGAIAFSISWPYQSSNLLVSVHIYCNK